jgi:hypothetical protein
MTNPTNSSQNRLSPTREEAHLKMVLQLVEASPFKVLLRLPPEEVLDFFRSRVGLALLLGLQALRDQSVADLMTSKDKHADVCDKLFEVRGIDSVCNALVSLPEKVKAYVEATKAVR